MIKEPSWGDAPPECGLITINNIFIIYTYND